jgi:hypothetical protein
MINVKAYITERFKLYKHHKIQDKMEKIISNSTNTSTSITPRELLIKRMNQIDRELTLISLQAERTIKSRPAVYSSPTINKLREALHEVRKLINTTKKGSSSLANYKKLRRQHIASLRQALRQQQTDRHRDELAKLNNMVQNGTDTAKRWAKQRRSQLTINKLKRIYNKLSYITGKRVDQTPLTVQIQVDGHPETLHDPDKIAQAIQAHNRRHFAQAQGGFFNQDTTRDIDDATNIIIHPQLPHFAGAPLHVYFAKHDTSGNIKRHQPSRLGNKVKKWRERTRTSPSGVHLGHYKALLKPVMEGDDETMEINLAILEIQNIMSQTQLDIVNLATDIGEPLQRWQKAINIAIPKQPGALNIDKFRNIHIYECDLNAMLSIKWKEALFKLEDPKQ